MKKIIGAFIFISLLTSCNKKFSDFGKYQGYWHTITINSNHTFYSECRSVYWNNIDTCRGTWIEKGGYLMLNSYRQPNNAKYFFVREDHFDTIKSGTKVIEVKTGTFVWEPALKDSTMTWFNKDIEINNKNYVIPFNGKLILKAKEINTIKYNWRFTDYPVYHVKNKNANYIFIELFPPESKDQIYLRDSYYSNEKFKIKENALEYKKSILKKEESNP